jgi:divalent metal cation (Fe/Co/Zn/Cd) transporter
MVVLVALTVGLVWWIAAWAFGIKAFDAFLVTIALVVGAAAYRMVKPFVDQLMGREAAPESERGVGF